MISTLGLLILFVIGVLTYYIFIKSKKKNPLPGPWGFPILGHMFQFGNYPHKTLAKWADQFGPIYELRLGPGRLVCVNDLKWVKEMYSQGPEFAGRHDHMAIPHDIFDGGIPHGIVFTEGELWEQLRRFTLRQLRDLGFGKTSMETYIMDEVNETLNWMKLNEGKPIENVKEKFTLAVVSALWSIISSQRCKHDDPKLLRIATGVQRAMEKITKRGNVALFALWTRHIIPEITGFNGLRRVVAELREFFIDAVTEHKKSYSEHFTRDLIDVFLKQIYETEDPQSAFYKDFGERQLIATISDLFQAGSDTTSTTLAFALLYLSKFQGVQTKLQKEIENVTGNSRVCSLTDRPSMPFTEALIAEITRYSSILPSGVPHRAVVEKEFKGFTIAKNDVIFANLYYIHHNPAIWGDPQNFRPERFLSEDGKSFKKNDALVPFSIGRRQCLGESLARDTLFLFITNIFQKFTVSPTCKPELIDLEPIHGFLIAPKPFSLILNDRLI